MNIHITDLRKDGFTIIEVVVSLLIISSVMAGLSIIFIFGLNSWQEAEKDMKLQQSGSYAIEEITKIFTRAKYNGITYSNNSLSFEYPYLNKNNSRSTRTTVFKSSGNRLYKDGQIIIPFDKWIDDIEVKGLRTEPFNNNYKISVTLAMKDSKEQKVFTSTVFPRN